jgi:hypothetical protein
VTIADFRELQRRTAWAIWGQRWLYERKTRQQQQYQQQQKQSAAEGQSTSARSSLSGTSLTPSNVTSTTATPNLSLYEIKTLAEEMISSESYLVVREYEELMLQRARSTKNTDVKLVAESLSDATRSNGGTAEMPMPKAEFARERLHSITASLNDVLWQSAAPFLQAATTSAQARDVMNLLETCSDFILRHSHDTAIEDLYKQNFPTYPWHMLPLSVRIAVEQLYFAGVILGVTYETTHNLFWTTCALRFTDLNKLAGVNANERLKVIYTQCLATFRERYQQFLNQRQAVNASRPLGGGRSESAPQLETLSDPMLTHPELFGDSVPPDARAQHSPFDPSAPIINSGRTAADESASSKKMKKKKSKGSDLAAKEVTTSETDSPRLRRNASGGVFSRLASALGSTSPRSEKKTKEPERSGSSTERGMASSSSAPSVRPARSSSVSTLPRDRSDRNGVVPTPQSPTSHQRNRSAVGPIYSNTATPTHSAPGSGSNTPRGTVVGALVYDAHIAMHILSIFVKFCWDSYYTTPTDAPSNAATTASSAKNSFLVLEPVPCAIHEGIAPLLRSFDLARVLEQFPCYVATPVCVMSFIWQLTPEMRKSPLIHSTLNLVHINRSEVISFEEEFGKTLSLTGRDQLRFMDVMTAYNMCAVIVLIAQVNQRHNTLQKQIMLTGQTTTGNLPLHLLEQCSREFTELHANMLTRLQPKRAMRQVASSMPGVVSFRKQSASSASPIPPQQAAPQILSDDENIDDEKKDKT